MLCRSRALLCRTIDLIVRRIINENIKGIDSFGSIDADNESILLDAFEEHEAFVDAIVFKRFLIIGKKGSGKLAGVQSMVGNRSFSV